MQAASSDKGNHSRLADIPAAIARSRLMQNGGFAVYEGMVDDGGRRLLREAMQQLRSATDCCVRASDHADGRGGVPARRFLTAPGGLVQRRAYTSPSALAFLRRLTHTSLQPTGALGTYSYYARTGDYLALHRDIVTCDVSVITCLADSAQGTGGGLLCLYPGRTAESLAAIRATPAHGAFSIRLRPAQTIVFYGGIVPHALLPVSPSQVRIVSVLCYRILAAA